MSHLVVALANTPGWTKKHWDGEPICTQDTNEKISKTTRCWTGPDGRTYTEDAAYNVAKGISKADDYNPVQPKQLTNSMWIINPES